VKWYLDWEQQTIRYAWLTVQVKLEPASSLRKSIRKRSKKNKPPWWSSELGSFWNSPCKLLYRAKSQNTEEAGPLFEASPAAYNKELRRVKGR